ncbi:MAG: efflux RND transporter periplasmic adaptor subunit, partial [Deltaproteobacteria bacterium]|nr:efflux RND transporter periplasmic adaptor subunit [Deltaproteobacteria bacterium]
QRHLWIAVPSIILLIITLILSYRYYERKQLQAADKSIKSINVVPVKTMISSLQNVDRYVRSSGVSKAWQQAIILSEVAGQVTSITAKVGDPLDPNAPILKIDDEMYRYTVEQAQASVQQLEASHATSKRELARKKALLKNEVISDYEFDYAGAKEKGDRAMLNSAKTQLKIARHDLRETLITSPIKGILAERTVDIGTNIARGTRIATVVDIEKIKTRVGISEKEIARIAPGQPVTISTDAYVGTDYRGTVYSVGTKADDITLTFPVEIMLVNDREPMIKPGMITRIAIKTGTYNAVMPLPQEAVQNLSGTSPFVWLAEQGQARKAFITPAGIEGSDILIKAGLTAGLAVITSGHKKLYEGCSVQVIESP